MKRFAAAFAIAAALLAPAAVAKDSPTKDGLIATYKSVADSLLAANAAEDALVRVLLVVERDAALAALDRATAAGGTAADLREAAGHVGDFATEGGSAVEPIRNKLLAGGIHHNSDDAGPDAVYDEGYVVITKKLKVEVLDLAKRAAKAAEAGKVNAAEVHAIREAFSSVATRVLALK